MIVGVTSAPDVREVDEFQEELSAAEKQKRRIQDKLVNGKPVPKDKLNLSVRKNEQVNKQQIAFFESSLIIYVSFQEVIDEETSTLESTLISEANKTRQKRLISKADEQLDADIADVFSEDTEARYGNGNSKSLMIVSEAEPEMENITEVAKRRKFNSFRETNGSRKENTFRLGNKPSSDAKMVSEFREKDKQKAQILPNKDKVIEDPSRNKNSTFVNLRGKQGRQLKISRFEGKTLLDGVDNTQQCFAFTPQANFPAHNLKVQVMGSNPGYLFKKLYFMNNCQKISRQNLDAQKQKGSF